MHVAHSSLARLCRRLPVVCVLVLALAVVLLPAVARAQVVSFDGVGTVLPLTGLTSPATLHTPTGVAVDGLGNVYIADTDNNRVVKVTAAGVATVLDVGSPAGLGLSNPYGVAADGVGDVYIADTNNNRVVVVTAVGAVSVLNVGSPGGLGLSNPFGVAVDGSGDVYIADYRNNRVVVVTAAGAASVLSTGSLTPGSLCTSTALCGPSGVALDSAGDVYIADNNNNRMVEVTAAGVASVMNVGSPGGLRLSTPFAVAADGAGDVFITDMGNSRVLEVTAAGVTSVVSIGSVQKGTYGNGTIMYLPMGVAVDAMGDVYIADTGNSRVVEASSNVNFGNVPVNSAATANQQTLTYTFSSDDTLTAVNVLTQGVANKDYIVDPSSTCVATGSYGPSGAATCTVVVDFSPAVPGSRMGAVQLVDANGVQATTYLRAVGQGPMVGFNPGVASGLNINTGINAGPANLYGGFSDCLNANLCLPYGVAVDAADDVFIADTFNNRVAEVTAAGWGAVLNVGTPGGAGLNFPYGVAVDGAGNVYISDSGNNRIVEVTAAGAVSVVSTPGLPPVQNSRCSGSALCYPTGIAVDGSGDLYISDTYNNRVVEVLAAGGASVLNTSGLTQLGFCSGADLCEPYGVAVDSAGNVFIADFQDDRVVEVTASGTASVLSTGGLPITGNCGSSGLCAPSGVAVDGAGDVYVTDYGNLRIVEISAAGVASVVSTANLAPSPYGPCSYNGLCYPFGLAVDGAGNIIIADSLANRIAVIDQAQASPLSFAAANQGYDSMLGPQNVSFQNIGNQVLNITSLGTTTTGQTNSSFNLNGAASSCSTALPLNAGQACILGVQFDPLTTGTLTGTVNIYDNNLYAASPADTLQQFAVTGIGVDYVAAIGLQESATTVTYGTPVTVTATLSGANGIPSGSISISVDGVTLGTMPLTAGATTSSAQFTLPGTIDAGTHGVLVSYSGDSNYPNITSTGFSLTVTAAPTTTTLSAPGTATAGSYITLTATVLSGSTPVTSGLVVFGYTNIIGPGAGISIGAAGSAKPQASSGTMYYTLGVGLLGTGGQATLYTTLPAGNYTIVAFYEGSLDYATSYSTGSNIAFSAVPPAATTTSLSAPATAVAGNSVNLTATVLAGSTPVTSGTVTFTSGTLSIGAAQLGSGGTATLATTLLPVGNDSVSASFLGTTSYATSTSSSSTVVVSAVTAPSYSISANPTSVSIAQGATGSITLTFTPVGGYSGTVLLSCGNLPSFVTCAFTQGGTADSTVVMSGNNQPVTVILTISTNVSTARLNALPGSRPNSPQSPAAPLLTAMVFWLPGGMAGIVAFSRRRKFTGKNRWLPLCLIGLVALALAAGLSACGGSGSVTPSGATTITVTATPSTGSNPSSSSQTLTLTITITT